MLWTPTSHQTLWAAVTRAVRTPSRIDEDLQLTGLGAGYPSAPYLLVFATIAKSSRKRCWLRSRISQAGDAELLRGYCSFS